jgi:NADP-dependent 3-hydroxy acid dehydrogenase YdfG
MKNRRPKPLQDQVIVITGASSGIGLATARMAARRGARVVMAARNEQDLKEAAEEIRANGGNALAVATDVSDEAAVSRLGEAALLEFGTVDTWVNNAGLSIYGKLVEVPLADKRKLFDINFWGVVHGCRTAIRLMKHRGGVLINIGSEVSDVAIPLQGIYSASKHAVKGYTDALRMELEHDRIPSTPAITSRMACRRCRRPSTHPKSSLRPSCAAPNDPFATSSSAAPDGCRWQWGISRRG